MKVRFLHRREVDTGKWDEVIAQSPAETIYPYSWYLDAAGTHWSALVMDDYRFVMPLVWKKKFGLHYIYQPFYTQQLGVFSKEYVDPTVIRSFLDRIPRKYRFAAMNFNTMNLVGEEKNYSVDDRTNYVLDLQSVYETLHTSYSTNAKRNLKKALDIGEGITKDLTCDELVAFKRSNDVIQRSEEEYSWLVQLLETIRKYSRGIVYGDREGDTLHAAAFFAFSSKRTIYLVSASTSEGKERRSMFKLVDACIREHAGSGLILDFEGSNIPSVARFFAGFGATPEIYQCLSFNRLPAIIRKVKRYGP